MAFATVIFQGKDDRCLQSANESEEGICFKL